MIIKKLSQTILAFFLASNFLHAQTVIRTDGCGTITARPTTPPLEVPAMAFDNKASTKWYDSQITGTPWIQYQFCNNESYAINSYILASAGDVPGRDPKSLNLYGSNDGINYILVESRSGIAFTARYQRQTFNFNNSAPYKYYKFEFVPTSGVDGLQLSEIELIESGTVLTVPVAPTLLSAAPVSSSVISLGWKDNATDETGYEVYRSETQGTGYLLIGTTGSNATGYTDGGLGAQSTHYYKVRAKNAQGCSAYTNETSATTLAASSTPVVRTDGCGTITARPTTPPLEVPAMAFDNKASTKWYDSQITGTPWIQYQFCNNESYAINSYILASAGDVPGRDPKSLNLYGSNDGINYTLVESRSGIAFTARYQRQTFNFNNSTPYKYYKFEFVSTSGVDGLQLSEIELLSNGTGSQGTLPLAPSSLQTLFVDPDLINLSWSDNSTDETSFTVEQSLSATFSTIQSSYTIGSNISRYIVNGLVPNTSYYFRIKSTNSTGSSVPSAILQVKTGVADIYPLKINAGKLSTNSGQPFLIVGDSPWSLIVGPDRTGIDKYLENRKQKGVNSLIINLVEHYYNGPADAYGNLPFLVTGDFSTPNPKYFDNADYVIGKAREKGMEVFLFPAYIGYDDGGSHVEGWYTEMNACGTAKMYQYGRYLGQRYKDYKNIVWVMGGDCAPGTTIDEIREIVRGIEETAGPQIFTVHNARYQSGITSYSGETWLDVNTTYACKATSASYLAADYQRGYPFFFIEGTYENLGATAANLRGEMYLPALMGSNGSFYGNYPLFAFESGWDDPSVLESQGALDLQRSGALLKSRSWNNLVPDLNHTLLIDGYGDISGSAYAAAALTKDAGSAIIYVPDYRKLTINLTQISGTLTHAWWYQPSNGSVVDASTYADATSQAFYPPSSTSDWLLILDDASLGYGAPGTANPLLKSTGSTDAPETAGADASININEQDFIYPNPARDQFHIMHDVSAQANVNIYDLQGKMILSQQVNDNTVDISDLPYGIYIVKLIDNDKILVGRLVKE